MEPYAYSHTLHSQQIMRWWRLAKCVCRVSESLTYSTAWYCMYILIPYTPANAAAAAASVCRVSESRVCSTAWWHGIVWTFSHPTYTANNACRMSESLVYSTAWNHMYIPTPYIHSKWCVVGSRKNVCVFLCVCLKRERKKFFRLRKFSPKFDQCLHCRSLSYVHVCVCVCAHTHARAIFA